MKVAFGRGFEPAPALPMRQRVERLESVLEQYPQVECPVRHHFAPGVYAREMTIPAGVIATGAVHKTEHLSIVVGHCLLTTDEGVKEFAGYHTFVSKPGAKRALTAISETVMTTIHPSDETDLDKLCELLTESTTAQLLGGAENKQLLAQKRTELED
jgi:hypothetical protein